MGPKGQKSVPRVSIQVILLLWNNSGYEQCHEKWNMRIKPKRKILWLDYMLSRRFLQTNNHAHLMND